MNPNLYPFRFFIHLSSLLLTLCLLGCGASRPAPASAHGNPPQQEGGSDGQRGSCPDDLDLQVVYPDRDEPAPGGSGIAFLAIIPISHDGGEGIDIERVMYTLGSPAEIGMGPMTAQAAAELEVADSDLPIWVLGPSGQEPCQLTPSGYAYALDFAWLEVYREFTGDCPIPTFSYPDGSPQWLALRQEEAPSGCHFEPARPIVSNGEPANDADGVTSWDQTTEPPEGISAVLPPRPCEAPLCRWGFQVNGNQLVSGEAVFEVVAAWVGGEDVADTYCEHSESFRGVFLRRDADSGLEALASDGGDGFDRWMYHGAISDERGLRAALLGAWTDFTLIGPGAPTEPPPRLYRLYPTDMGPEIPPSMIPACELDQ